MTPIPLDQLGFDWRDHKSALWWMGLLYRRPAAIHEELEALPWWQQITRGLLLYVHFLPYLILLCGIGRWIVFGDLGNEAVTLPPTLPDNLWRLTNGIAVGMVIGITVCIVFGIIGGIAFGIVVGIASTIAGSCAVNVITFGHPFSLAFVVFAWLPFGIVVSIAVDIVGGINYGMAVGMAVFVVGSCAVGFIFGPLLIVGILRLYYFPIHWWLIWPKPRLRWASLHPALWDDLCVVSFPGLHRLLVAQAETQRWRGKYHIESIIAYYPAQRHEALKAKTTLLARRAGRTADLTQLDTLLARLPDGSNDFLTQTTPLRVQVSEISRLQVVLNTVTLPAFRKMQAEMLIKEIEHFRDRIAGYHEPLATEFRAAASQWLRLAQDQLEGSRQSSAKEPTPQVFRAGDPVDSSVQEAFTPRYAVIESLRQQVMLQTGCPGIVLYGRRRIGKSTLLRNLTGFLPPEVLTVNVSMQNPSLAASLTSFVRTLAEQLQTQARELKLNESLPEDLPGMFRFLTTANDKLAAVRKRLLLAVDEYEAIDNKIGDGVLPNDLLDALRESIQTHRRLTWIFAGSHEIDELPQAAWISALVSARTIEVPAFTLAETRLLLTEPLKHSSLWRGNEAKRPRFDAAFWGTEEGSGIDFIHAQAGGWPHLVQLIAETLVDLLNAEEARAVTSALLQRALDKAIVRGHNVLYELLRRECTLPGEWEYLECFKQLDAQPAPDGEAIARSLRRRELMAVEGDEWRLRVPLMQRWLRVRG